MIDLNDLRERPEAYQKAATNKGIDISIDGFLLLDTQRRELQQRLDEMREEKNKVSKAIPSLSPEERDRSVAEMKALGENMKSREEEFTQTDSAWRQMQLLIPSIPLDKVPVGKDDSENVEIRTWAPQQSPTGSAAGQGAPITFDFEPKDHVTLGEELDIIDIPRGVKIAGSRSYFLKGDGARLEFAVLQFTLNHLVEKGFTAFIPPVLANYNAMMGTSYFPGGEEQAYAVGADREPQLEAGEEAKLIESDQLYLVGTSEVSVASYHGGETLEKQELPKRYVGISNCFRREAGTYGKDTRGLYRIHQFQKVEQVILCEANPEVSAKMHQEILSNAEAVLQALELPYRVVDVCTGDMGQGQVYKNDIETWMPSRDSYGETHSCSTFYEFQSRRLNMKYIDDEGKKRYVHTLNNTCIASPRILIPLLEIYQNADGSITIPQALRPYMGGQERIEPRS